MKTEATNRPKLTPGTLVKFKSKTHRVMGVCHHLPTGDLCYALKDDSRNIIYIETIQTVENQYRVL